MAVSDNGVLNVVAMMTWLAAPFQARWLHARLAHFQAQIGQDRNYATRRDHMHAHWHRGRGHGKRQAQQGKLNRVPFPWVAVAVSSGTVAVATGTVAVSSGTVAVATEPVAVAVATGT